MNFEIYKNLYFKKIEPQPPLFFYFQQLLRRFYPNLFSIIETLTVEPLIATPLSFQPFLLGFREVSGALLRSEPEPPKFLLLKWTH